MRLLLAAALVLAGSLPAHAENRELAHLGREFTFLAILMLVFVVWGFRRTAVRYGFKAAVENALRFVLVIPLTWLPLALLHALTGFPSCWTSRARTTPSPPTPAARRIQRHRGTPAGAARCSRRMKSCASAPLLIVLVAGEPPYLLERISYLGHK